MITLQEVANVASVLIGKPVDAALAKLYLTDGLRLVTTKYPTACPIRCTRVECSEENQAYSIPNHLGVYKVYRDKQRYFEYSVEQEGITFSHKGEYQVYYYSSFSGELSWEESIPIAAEYESELCKYVAFCVLRSDDPSNRVADRLVEEFYENCDAIHRSISGQFRRKSIPLQAPRWR